MRRYRTTPAASFFFRGALATTILWAAATACLAPPTAAQEPPDDEEWAQFDDEDWDDEDWDDEDWDDEDWNDEDWDDEDWNDEDWNEETGEWELSEDLSVTVEIPADVRDLIDRNARQIVENLERSADSYVAALDHLIGLSFNESMRATRKDFGELLGEKLTDILLGGLAKDLPKLGTLKITDLPSFIPVLEALDGRDGPPRTVGHWLIARRDDWLRRRANLVKTEELVFDLESEYEVLDPAGRAAFAELLRDGLLDALDYRVPDHVRIERGFWEAWLDAHFDPSASLGRRACYKANPFSQTAQVAGCIEIWFETEDDYLLSASPDFRYVGAFVSAPGSDVVTAGLNRVLADGEVGGRILGLAARKRVCFGRYADWETAGFRSSGTVCGWLGPDSEILAEPTEDGARRYFAEPTWRRAGAGGHIDFEGWE